MKSPIIIGAGVSGLVAAIELERSGYAPIILEATGSVGGRVKSDKWDGTPLDHGFQVLLTAYPEAQRYLDYQSLDLIEFLPGSVIFKNGRLEKIGDPLRSLSFLFPVIFAKVGSLRDKYLIYRLSMLLKKKSIQNIFSDPETTTIDYLRKYGFSEGVIHDFFQPFFAGIYLEDTLDTSSRMFEFVYKMFALGNAAVPRKGMQAIPEQLAGKLLKTTIRYSTPVSHVDGRMVHLESGESLSSDQIIIATDPAMFYPDRDVAPCEWQSCYNLYFYSETSVLADPIIGLLPGKETLVNNFHFLNDLSSGDSSILSVTIVKSHGLSESDMIQGVRDELLKLCNIKTGDMLKMYHIKKALPKISELKYEASPAAMELAPGIYGCGDHMANASLNAAMASGRLAAELLNTRVTG